MSLKGKVSSSAVPPISFKVTNNPFKTRLACTGTIAHCRWAITSVCWISLHQSRLMSVQSVCNAKHEHAIYICPLSNGQAFFSVLHRAYIDGVTLTYITFCSSVQKWVEHRITDAKRDSDFDEIWDDTALIIAYDRAINSAKTINEERRKNSQSESFSECSSNASSFRNKNLQRRRKGSGKGKANAECRSWIPEDHCRAVYSADGVTYEAEIKSINPETKTCVVQFVGYGNEEEVMMNKLQPSFGEQARTFQIEESRGQAPNLEEDCNHSNKGAYPKRKRNARSKIRQTSEHHNSQYQQNGLKTEKQQRASSSVSNHQLPDTSGQPFFMQGPFPSFAPSSMIPPMVFPPPPLPLSEDVEEDDEALSSMLMSWYMSGYHTGYYQGLKCGRNKAPASNYSTRGSRRQSPACSHRCNKCHH